MLDMSGPAWFLFIHTIKFCCFLLLCSAALMVEFNGSMYDNYSLYMTAAGLNEISQAIFLTGMLAAVIAEDIQS